jgi:2,4-dienoyl-CoA reductase-like NADH-dependent reductase (Old Yellow Enzyme family)
VGSASRGNTWRFCPGRRSPTPAGPTPFGRALPGYGELHRPVPEETGVWLAEEDRPLFVRLSATDWAPGGWDVGETVELSRRLTSHGVDLIDVTSGGLVPGARIEVEPGYQVPFARAVREGSGLPVSAVWWIVAPEQADQILVNEAADAVMLARELLRNPHWPWTAARALGDQVPWPPQYVGAQRRQ